MSIQNPPKILEYIKTLIPEFEEEKFEALYEYVNNAFPELGDTYGSQEYACGFSNEEEQADAYFEGGYQKFLEIAPLNLNIFIAETDKGVFFTTNADEFDLFSGDSNNKIQEIYHLPDLYIARDYGENVYAFKSFDEAEKYAMALSGAAVCFPIEELVANFNTELRELSKPIAKHVNVTVKKEYNNSGRFHSYDIHFDDMLLEDGIFTLDAEQIIKDCRELIEIKQTLSEQWMYLDNVKKEKHGFERYYTLDISKKMGGEIFTIEHEIHIMGTQGQPRTTLGYISDALIGELESINEAFEELYVDERQEQDLLEFCNVTEEVTIKSEER